MWHATKRKARPYGKPSVDPELGIDLIREQICAAEKLRQSELITGYHVDDWDNTTLNYVEKAFGPNHRNLQVFQNATATAGNYSGSQEQRSTQYAKDLHGKTTLLEGFIGQLQKEIHLRRLVTSTAPYITEECIYCSTGTMASSNTQALAW
jgi:hypothetical protein